MLIPISHIKTSKRLRPLDELKVAELAKSIEYIGLLQPIVVDTENNLLAGFHRLTACIKLGHSEIECNQVDVAHQKKQLVEIDENLVSNDLTVLQKAEHIVLKEKILKELGIRAEAHQNRYTRHDNLSSLLTNEELGKQIGVSSRHYQRLKQVGKINEKARQVLKQTEVADNMSALIEVQKLNDDDLQIEVAERIKKGYLGEVKGLVSQTSLVTPSPFGRGDGRRWKNRDKDDFYPTHPSITQMLLDREEFEGSIYEPSCGEGHISKVLIDAGYDVFSTDLVDRGYGISGIDFLNDNDVKQYYGKFDNLITNPPFKYGKEFVAQAKKVARKKIAIFHTTNFLGGVHRYKMWQDWEFPLRTMYQFSGRVTFKPSAILGQDVPSGSWILWSWYIFEKGFKGKPTIEWILPEPVNYTLKGNLSD